jgi:hypothetical protein
MPEIAAVPVSTRAWAHGAVPVRDMAVTQNLMWGMTTLPKRTLAIFNPITGAGDDA